MPISNYTKGIISLIAGIVASIGALEMFQDPHSFYGLAIMIASAVIGATKHWADTQDSTTTPEQTPPTTQ